MISTSSEEWVEKVARVVEPRLANEEWRRNYAAYVPELEAIIFPRAREIIALLSSPGRPLK